MSQTDPLFPYTPVSMEGRVAASDLAHIEDPHPPGASVDPPGESTRCPNIGSWLSTPVCQVCGRKNLHCGYRAGPGGLEYLHEPLPGPAVPAADPHAAHFAGPSEEEFRALDAEKEPLLEPAVPVICERCHATLTVPEQFYGVCNDCLRAEQEWRTAEGTDGVEGPPRQAPRPGPMSAKEILDARHMAAEMFRNNPARLMMFRLTDEVMRLSGELAAALGVYQEPAVEKTAIPRRSWVVNLLRSVTIGELLDCPDPDGAWQGIRLLLASMEPTPEAIRRDVTG